MKKIDYKGKYYIIQDEAFDDGFDIEIGEISKEELTDEFLENHVKECIYYGIPAVITRDKELSDRVDKIYEKLNLN